jgi:DNA polymerase-4
VPGIGPKTSVRLERLALSTLAALAAADERLLVEHFGPNHGRDLLRRARFEHDGAVGTPRKVASESRERTFERDLRDPAQMRTALERMARELCASLAKRERRGRTIGIKVRLDDFTTVTRARTLAEPTFDPELVCTVALALLARYAPVRPVRLLGVRVAGLTAAADAGTERRAAPVVAQGPARTAGASAARQLGLPV